MSTREAALAGVKSESTLAALLPGAWGRLPSWAAVLLLYAVSRVFSSTLLALMSWIAVLGSWPFASSHGGSGFFFFSGSWDASFYRRIAEDGYPLTLPMDSAGHVLQNPWAFLPIYPMVVKGAMAVTGLSFYPAGVLVAVLCGAGAALLLYRVVESRTSRSTALWSTAFFCFGPLSFVLQVAYAESLFLLLVFGSLLAVIRRRYLMLIPLGVAAAFTRPGALALALALGIHLLVRWRSERPFPLSDRLKIVLAAAVISAAGLTWPVIASAVTGTPEAYLQTELSWWVGFVGRPEFVPLTPWFIIFARYLGWGGVLLVISAVVGFALWLCRRPTFRLGNEIIGFSGSYALYLFAVFLPQQSLFRLLLPLAPLLGSETFTGTRRRRRVVLIGGVALQPLAIVLLWFLGYP